MRSRSPVGAAQLWNVRLRDTFMTKSTIAFLVLCIAAPALLLLERYPERFAQEALGHNSKAVHRAYAKRALMKIPSLEDYEQLVVTKAKMAT